MKFLTRNQHHPFFSYLSIYKSSLLQHQRSSHRPENIHLLCMEKMRAKPHYSFNLKMILIGSFFILLLFLILRLSFSSNAPSHTTSTLDSKEETKPENCPTHPGLIPSCTQIPASLAHALVHYATLNITPQQTIEEISVSLKVLEKKSPCNFLVFGLGRDSLMWTSLNHGGRTVFLEEDKQWIEQIQKQIPSLESYHVVYNSKVNEADELLEISKKQECKAVTDPRFSRCQLALKGLPADVYRVEWDLIMVDAPTGYYEGAPGRMSAIYTVGLLARNRENGETDVFVHDVNREVEDKFSKALLCEGYMRQEEGRLRHFTIPSHRTREGRSFCP